MIFITGDTHGEFARIIKFAEENGLSSDDIIIVLGDAGINFFGFWKDRRLKKKLAKQLPATLLCIHGNHEKRPEKLKAYQKVPWMGGMAYIEPEFPRLVFARDGEIYDLEGIKTMAMGGAVSIDKEWRLANPDHKGRVFWWPDEQPSDEIKARIKTRLEQEKWRIDVVLSHTCPLESNGLPIWRTFELEARSEGPKIHQHDFRTEEFLGEIEARLDYKKWFFGHFHVTLSIGRFQAMGNEIYKFNADPKRRGSPEESLTKEDKESG